jgi:NAD+ synthase (glutamine-hydrolysing)
MKTLRVALAQINTTVGDLDGNAAKVLDYVARARDQGADVVAFPELTLPGYPPEDLLMRSRFIDDNIKALHYVASQVHGITAAVGFADSDTDLFNAAAVLHDGQVKGVYHKQYLPNYGVFDERRYFLEGQRASMFTIAGAKVGLSICEDLWYAEGAAQSLGLAGADVVLNLSGSPYHHGKRHFRQRMFGTRAADNAVIVAHCNLAGGQDELVFDGNSMVLNHEGDLIAHAPAFEEHLLVIDLDLESLRLGRLHVPLRRYPGLQQYARPVDEVFVSDAPTGDKPAIPPATNVDRLDHEAELYKALVTGTRDYVHKNGFETVIVGMSGGIDSSLVATIATDALGPEHVVGVSNPSRYSSEGSIADARALADNLGIKLMIIPIEEAHAAYLDMLDEPFRGTEPGTAEENIQARIRGNIWMALSNKFGWQPVLTCGNKSEMSVGYATLYGDMAGGFAVIKDVPKSLCYKLAAYRNTAAGRELIPQTVIDKPPSAELRPDQLDTDSLPPYDVLDPILEAYVEDDRSVDEIVSYGYDEATVRRIVNLVDRNEYKRRQAPPGIKITTRAFGRDRRLPITNRYRN